MIATSIEQAKRMLEAGVLIESADMYWHEGFDYPMSKNRTSLTWNQLLPDFPPAWSLSALWQMIHDLDKTYEFPTELSADELIEVLVKTIIFRKNQDARKGMD